MIFGNIQGLVNGTETVVFDSEVAGAAVSSISTGDILNGDEDGWYTVIARNIYDTGTDTMTAYFNADSTTSNYGYRGITANNTTVADINSTGALIRMGAVASGSTSAFSVLRFYAKQGSVRMLNGMNVCNINGTTVTQLETISSVYSVTNTNITGMTFAANKLGVGTRIIILKSNNFTNGTPTGVITTPYIKGSWVRVGSTTLGSAAAYIEFTGLSGDRDIVYYLSVATKCAVSGNTHVRLNSNTGTVYGYQYADAGNTTIAAGRGALTSWYLELQEGDSANEFAQQGMLIFAKTGFVRPAICWGTNRITGTTVGHVTLQGASYNETATDISTLRVYGDGAGNCIAAGSTVELYALRPNG